MQIEQLAQRIVAHRMKTHGLTQFKPWRAVAKELGLKNTDIRRIRRSDEYLEAAKCRTKAKIDAFQKAVGKPPKYHLVHSFVKTAFGFDKDNVREIIDECMPKS